MTPELAAETPGGLSAIYRGTRLDPPNGEAFCREEIAPFAQEWDEAGIFPREIFRKAADLGLFGIRVPTELGGSGLDWWATAAAHRIRRLRR